MSYYEPYAKPPPRLLSSMNQRVANAAPMPQTTSNSLVEKWITDMRPVPELPLFPEELILAVGSWILGTFDCWLDHHWGRGYDVGILTKKAKRAPTSGKKYGPHELTDGWWLLVESAFDKANFPDDEYMTQWRMNKPTPHTYIEGPGGLGITGAIEKYQPRGEEWMRVMYDILTEHECHNLELYPYLNDEALKVRVKAPKYRYLQALISASDLLIRMWSVPIAAMTTNDSVINNQLSIVELPKHNHTKGSLLSLAYTFLVANKLMQIDPDAQTQRKLYPHPPIGPDIWHNAEGEIDPNGLGWIPRVKDSWKGRVYVMGQYAKITSSDCPWARSRLNRAPLRMCLDFHPNGQIIGQGGDYGGRFVIEGFYEKTYVELRKTYEDEDGDEDAYLATGHMIPWGVYGRWTTPEAEEDTLGYWCMWHYEGAPAFPLTVPYKHAIGTVYPQPEPYKVKPDWFEEYERNLATGKHIDRMHGWFTDPPPQPENVPLPEPDVWGL